jgi:hypothetical protein
MKKYPPLFTGDDVIILRGYWKARNFRVKHISANGRWVFLHCGDGLRLHRSNVEKLVPKVGI